MNEVCKLKEKEKKKKNGKWEKRKKERLIRNVEVDLQVKLRILKVPSMRRFF